ncbi:MAG: alpha/beta hydrolase [Rhodospirillaceae bacterium]|nr:alpha/beta hydrolase [Rhodospirillales bacterium]
MKTTVTFTSGRETIVASRYAAGGQKPAVLVMHGAGQADRTRTDFLCSSLLERGVPSLSMDFSGHGESTRNCEGSILKRIEEAQSAIHYLGVDEGISLIGFSMSGQVAISMLPNPAFSVENVILFSPAIYCDDAIPMPFGPEFSACIRRPDSWREARCDRDLRDFNGNLLIVTPEHDPVVPSDVARTILDNAVNAKTARHVPIPGAPHVLGKWLSENLNVGNAIVDAVAGVIIGASR